MLSICVFYYSVFCTVNPKPCTAHELRLSWEITARNRYDDAFIPRSLISASYRPP